MTDLGSCDELSDDRGCALLEVVEYEGQGTRAIAKVEELLQQQQAV